MAAFSKVHTIYTLFQGIPKWRHGVSYVGLEKKVGRPPPVELPPLYDAPIKIKLAKYKNLLELLPFIPPIHHQFYKTLPHDFRGKNKDNHSRAASTPVGTEEEDGIASVEEFDHILESDCGEWMEEPELQWLTAKTLFYEKFWMFKTFFYLLYLNKTTV